MKEGSNQERGDNASSEKSLQKSEIEEFKVSDSKPEQIDQDTPMNNSGITVRNLTKWGTSE